MFRRICSTPSTAHAPGSVTTSTLSAAQPSSVSFNGSLGQKAALLLIDGEPRTVLVGNVVGGVRLISLSENFANVEFGGRRHQLTLGASPGRVGEATPAPFSGRQIVLSAGPGGHFTTVDPAAVAEALDDDLAVLGPAREGGDTVDVDGR